MNISVSGYGKALRGRETQDIFYLSQMGIFPSGLVKRFDRNPVQVDDEISPGDLFFFIQGLFNLTMDLRINLLQLFITVWTNINEMGYNQSHLFPNATGSGTKVAHIKKEMPSLFFLQVGHQFQGFVIFSEQFGKMAENIF